MWENLGPPLRAGALTAFVVGLLFLFVNPPSFAGLENLIRIIAGALAFIVITGTLIVLMTGSEMPESQFQRLVNRSEWLARQPPAELEPTYFDEMVIEALDDLPQEFRHVLREIPVIISLDGHERRAYGLYSGDTVARGNYANRIIIYEDTLVRDFGHDSELLRAQVHRVVRHEVAHHLGWDERGVRGLGL